MISAEEYKRLIDFAYKAHQEHGIHDNEIYREKGRFPYVLHPIFCANLVIFDNRIPFEQREIGFKALILHDVLEKTSLELPDWVEPEVKEAVQELTFKSFSDAIRKVPRKKPFIKLLILADTLSTLYEEHIETFYRRKIWKTGVWMLTRDVEAKYGNIRIVQVSKTILKNTNW